MKRILVAFVFCIFFIQGNAQSKKEQPIWINISYFGESVVHPGAKLGVQYNLKTNETIKNRRGKKGPKIKVRDFVAAGYIGGYNHPNNEMFYFLSGEIGYRATSQKGFKKEIFLGIGGYKTFYNIETYQIGPNAPQPIDGAGRAGVMPSISLGFGQDLSMNSDLPIAWHIKPTFYLQLPYNHSFTGAAALDIGITINLNKCNCPTF